MSDEDETRARSQEALLEDSLADTLDLLRHLPESAQARGLRREVDRYYKTLARWMTVPPSKDQRDALLELVVELCSRAKELHASEEPTPLPPVRSVRPRHEG
jgi:flagellar hook-associated protein FlgK